MESGGQNRGERKPGPQKRVIQVKVKMENYDSIAEEAERARIPVATYCRKILTEGDYKLNLRQPEELEILRKICANTSEIRQANQESLRQIRLSGQATKNMEQAITEQNAVLDRLIRRLEK